MKVVIAGGGTAGHVNPGLALAQALRDEDVTFYGTPKGAEATLVPGAGFVLLKVDIAGFDRARPTTLLTSGVRALGAIRRVRKDLKLIAPDVVVGLGGYVSLPACFAARSLRIPVVLHEQNIVLGLSNRVCKRGAAAVAVSFEETLETAGPHGVLTGNPVRPEVAHADLAAARRAGLERYSLDPGRKTVLVFGGSQGAQRINDAAVGLAARWATRRDLQFVHIAGRAHAQDIKRRIAEFSREVSEGGLVYRVLDYVDDMVPAYASADLAVCRGGATTVAELGVVGLPAVIVPYPHHRDRQQERHGEVLAQRGAAEVLSDADTDADTLGNIVDRLIGSDEDLERMHKAALDFGKPDAAATLAGVVRKAA